MNKLLTMWLCFLSTVLLMGGVFADVDGFVDHTKKSLSGEKQLLVDRVYANRQTTLQTNKSGTISMLKYASELRQNTYDACKIMVGQALSGVITKNVALTQCKTMKEQMETTIKQMRKDVQLFRKNNREQTKKENELLKKELKIYSGSHSELTLLGSGRILSGERKELVRIHEGRCSLTGGLLTGDNQCNYYATGDKIGFGFKKGKIGGGDGGGKYRENTLSDK